MNRKPKFHYEIAFPDFPPSDAVKIAVEEHLARLGTLYSRIVSCHVAIRAPHQRSRKNLYSVHIRLEVPREDIVVSREPAQDDRYTDVYLAIQDAFKDLKKQLQKQIDRQQDPYSS